MDCGAYISVGHMPTLLHQAWHPTMLTPARLPMPPPLLAPKHATGYVGIQQEECELRACCWRPEALGPWCYQPQGTATTYRVQSKHTAGQLANVVRMQTQPSSLSQCVPRDRSLPCACAVPLPLHLQGSCTTLTLGLDEPVLPRYGRDFDALTVLVEPQTPQRLHLKISPPAADSSGGGGSRTNGTNPRWEVPGFLVPRYAPVPPQQLPQNPSCESLSERMPCAWLLSLSAGVGSAVHPIVSNK